ncbi:MAG: hypothetical protein PVH40_08415 [Gemmatimonadales bacterium]|jgi:hypothetical protein
MQPVHASGNAGHLSNPLVRAIRWATGSPARAFLLVFSLAFVVRLWSVSLIQDDLIAPNSQWENGAVAISLAESGRFADPYIIPTGPTAHVIPLYVGTTGLLYRVLGIGYGAGLVRWILIAAAYSVLWGLLPWVGQRLGLGREAGFVGGLAGALVIGFPAEIEPLSALTLLLLMMAFLSRWFGKWGTPARSLVLGVAVGVAFHLQPALLPVVLGFLAFEMWRNRLRQGAGLLALVFGMAIACVPWGVRNYRTFDALFFIRSNFGLELYVGNHDNAHADIDVSSARGSFRHPRTDVEEAERVLELGEARYMREKQREAVQWIREHPGAFLQLTATRIAYFWAGPLHRLSRAFGYLVLLGVALVGAWYALPSLTGPARAALFIPLLTYPLVYYVVAYMPRYGEPVRWILFLLAGAAVWRWLAGSHALRGPTPYSGR